MPPKKPDQPKKKKATVDDKVCGQLKNFCLEAFANSDLHRPLA
jgi:hypothetical protein